VHAIVIALIGLSSELVASSAYAEQQPVAGNVRWARIASEAYVERAETARRRGDTAYAITEYMRALRADPTFEKPYFGLSEIRRAAGDLREAELLLTQAVRIPDARAEALARRSAIYSIEGRDQLALLDLEAAARAEPTAGRLRDLATGYAARRAWVAALSVYRRLHAEANRGSDTDRAETEEMLAALGSLAAEADAVQHDAGERNWVRRALRHVATRLERRSRSR